ncbi:DNA mismatch endonuclease Vsr [Sphingomonas sp. G-3-2-10]|nr:DNA mismatch endonuclease Vsr [Sphingomonas sp. G-3-2-10]
MRSVRSHNTTPELTVRKAVTSLGFRYRLHRKSLPGCPDLVFAGRRKVIFVHGCFWHGHDCKRGSRIPKTNASYWTAKIQRNRDRDCASNSALNADRWRVLVIWECEIRDREELLRRIAEFLA